MLHKGRVWSLKPATFEGIVDLPNHDYCSCAGFSYEHEGHTYLLLSDAFPGGTSEYAICRVLSQDGEQYTVSQHESVTFGWCTPDKVREQLARWLTWWQDEDSAGWVGKPMVVTCEHYMNHGYRAQDPDKYCHLCA